MSDKKGGRHGYSPVALDGEALLIERRRETRIVIGTLALIGALVVAVRWRHRHDRDSFPLMTSGLLAAHVGINDTAAAAAWAYAGPPKICMWTPSTRTAAWFCLTDGPSRTFELDEAELPASCKRRAAVRTCASGRVRAMIAGPFYTRPGEWHTLGLDYSELLEPNEHVVSFTSDAVERLGEPVAYPPLHLHHIHVMRDNADHWYETHGDYELFPRGGLALGTEGDAHTGGYTRWLPDGYCDDASGTGRRLLFAQVHMHMPRCMCIWHRACACACVGYRPPAALRPGAYAYAQVHVHMAPCMCMRMRRVHTAGCSSPR